MSTFLIFCAFSLLPFTAKAIGDLRTPDEVLSEAYKNSQILLIATANHSHSKTYHYLDRLLHSLKSTDSLRFIVFERFHDNAAFYESLSVRDLKDTMRIVPFKSKKSEKNSLCFEEWAYTISDFFPRLRALNSTRKTPILATSIDGIHSENGSWWPEQNATYAPGNCELKRPYTIYAASSNREEDTQKNFSHLYRRLLPNEKMIIVYHHAHLLKSFQSCFPRLESITEHQANWSSDLTSLSWFDRAIAKHPEITAKVKMVLLDEIDASQNPDGAYVLSDFISNQFPNKSSGLSLQKTIPSYTQVGLDVFKPHSFMKGYQEGLHRSSQTLYQMADFLIWSHDSQTHFKLKEARDYLPENCSTSE